MSASESASKLLVMHYISVDLDHEIWVTMGMLALETYLAKVARFQERYGD